MSCELRMRSWSCVSSGIGGRQSKREESEMFAHKHKHSMVQANIDCVRK